MHLMDIYILTWGYSHAVFLREMNLKSCMIFICIYALYITDWMPVLYKISFLKSSGLKVIAGILQNVMV